MTRPAPVHSFAGFTWPRRIARHTPNRILGKRSGPQWCFAYYSDPHRAPGAEVGFYLGSDFQPGLRWQWCDEMEDSPVDHRGWFTDECQSDTIRGLVFRLPHGRGFLAGWSMGEGMASTVSRRVYSTERAAIRAADSMAESAAESERDYQDAWRAGQEAGEARAENFREVESVLIRGRAERDEARKALRCALATREDASGIVPPGIAEGFREAYRVAVIQYRAAVREAREALAAARDAFRSARAEVSSDLRDAFNDGARAI